MRQVFQRLDDGTTYLEEVPAPAPKPGHLLVRTHASVLSSGTERMLLEFGRANLIQKARQQPERVRQVLDKMVTDGVGPTVEAVRAKLSEPLPLGYTAAGVVMDVGPGVRGFEVGDRVVTNGPHAEVVSVPANLCARITADDVPFEHAAFTPLAAIALQGLRLAEPTIGERFVVTGLGLIGLLAVQLLRAQGCQVVGIDSHPDRLELARRFGAQTVDLAGGEDPLFAAESFSRGEGVDGVFIAAATDSNEPVRQAAEMCRRRGRIVLVGVVGLDLERQPFYEKELSFQVSCSYGPGRYDPQYEDEGHDYPQGFVRWTAGRNFEAVIDLLGSGQLDMAPLVSSRHAIADAPRAYEELAGGTALGIVLNYPQDVAVFPRSVALHPRAQEVRPGKGVVAFIGAGNYALRTLLPALAKTDARLLVIASRGGADASRAGKKFGFEQATSDVDSVFDDPTVDTVFIATRHDSHAALTARALEAGKHVFVEKPLALSHEELDRVRAAYESHADQVLYVGFNRRFAPLTRELIERIRPLTGASATVITVNAGSVPKDHWIHDPSIGGGRIIGEACHFIDLARAISGRRIVTVESHRVGEVADSDAASITLGFEDDSLATVHYLTGGSPRFPKERVEVFASGQTYAIENFRRLRSYSPAPADLRSRVPSSQDKGHDAIVGSFLAALRTGRSGVATRELFEVSAATINAATRGPAAIMDAREQLPASHR